MKHTKKWFINRIGKEIVKFEINLFSPPILINNESQAISLYITQTKGYRYSEIV